MLWIHFHKKEQTQVTSVQPEYQGHNLSDNPKISTTHVTLAADVWVHLFFLTMVLFCCVHT